jgi:hypothetical protein
MDYLEVYHLASRVLEIFFQLMISSLSSLCWKNTFCIILVLLNLSLFYHPRYVTSWCIFHSMSAWKECALCYCSVECSLNVNYFWWLSSSMLLWFLARFLFIIERGTLKSLATIVNLSLSPLVLFALYVLQLSCLVHMC